MKAVLQRVRRAEVHVEGLCAGRIEQGLLVYVGLACGDGEAQVSEMARKVANIRIFQDASGKMNLTVQDVGGSVLAVPNFTLLADAGKGRRPAFVDAADPKQASLLFDRFVATLKEMGCGVEAGAFGTHMEINSQADGPVNIILDMPCQGEKGQSKGEETQ